MALTRLVVVLALGALATASPAVPAIVPPGAAAALPAVPATVPPRPAAASLPAVPVIVPPGPAAALPAVPAIAPPGPAAALPAVPATAPPEPAQVLPKAARAGVPAQTAVQPTVAKQPVDPLLEAEILITQKRNDEARKLLVALDAKPSGERARDNQVQFLLGLLDMADKDYDSAISRFRHILVSEPENVRVRLEIGRAFFEEGRYGDAQRQFLYARAGNLPPTVRVNIDRILNSIRQLKTFSYSLAFAIAPDTNLNAGPATNTVSLYGLPFQLSPNAKANSGIGVTLDGSAEWAPRIGDIAKWRLGAQLHRAQYYETQFDDMTLAAYSGPHVTLERWDLNLLGSASRRWYGDRGYSASYGSSADATYYVNTRLGVGLNGALSQINYDLNALQNGFGRSVGLSFFYTPTTASFVQGTATVGWQGARSPAYAYDTHQFSLSYTRDFAGGLTAGVAPSFTMIDYDAALAAFSEARRDRQYAIQISLLYRKFDFHGLTPRIAYTYIRNDSNLDLFNFSRSRFEFGFTSSF